MPPAPAPTVDLDVTVEEVAERSAQNANRVGDRLQDRILQIVVPHLAQGFAEDRQHRLGLKRRPTEQELADLLAATLNLVYRLLFLLYAEGRELLPVGTSSGLKTIQHEIAAQAGKVPGEVFDRLAAAYSDSETALDDRLRQLFDTLSEGVPLVSANFRRQNRVSDRWLAIAIDGLSRDRSQGTRTLAFIDYKSLDVRRLGTIYEASLSCTLRAVLSNGERQRPEVCRFSLANDSGKRKATGSYYTPAAIVEYLITHTIGPVLDEKLNNLRHDFGRGFDLRVLDPAMGCGHFLVEAVRFIATRLADLPEGFPPCLPRDRRLLKRYVLEHCIYGVDLDPTAVELAKAALWLDAGVPDAPLTFLDQNLRSGNALVGDLPTAGRSNPPRRRADWQFFHWKGEFPAAFRGSQTPGGAGFDCVVGNPPYVRIQNLDDALVEYLREKFETAAGKFDLYIPFLERGTDLLCEHGLLGMIVPNKLLTADYGAAFRRFAARNRLVRQLVDFESERVFPGAGTYCCLVFLGKRPSDTITVSRGSLERRPIAGQAALLPSAHFGQSSWSVQSASNAPVGGIPLKAACQAIFQGLITGGDRLLIGKRQGDSVRLGTDLVEFDPAVFRPVLKGPDVRRFALRFSEHYALYPYHLIGGRTELIAEAELAARHRGVYRYLCRHRHELEQRGSPSMDYPAWYAHWCPRTIERFAAPKIVTQVLASRASFALDRDGTYTFVGGGNAGVYGIIPAAADEDRLWLLLAILNSRAFDAQVQSRSSRFRGGYFSYARRFIENTMIPHLWSVDLSASLSRRILDLAKGRARCEAEGDNPPGAELEAAVDELYQCGTR